MQCLNQQEAQLMLTTGSTRLAVSLYCATLCVSVSAVFAVARCLSDMLVYCIQVAEDIVKLLSWPGSPLILVFWSRAPVFNSKGTPSAGAQNTLGEKNLRFSTEITVYLGNGTWLLGNVNMKSLMADRYVSVLMTLSNLERRDTRVKFFSDGSH